MRRMLASVVPLILLTVLFAGCHEAADDPEVVPGAGEPEDPRPACVPEHIAWPLKGTRQPQVACPPDHPPRFPVPEREDAGPRIVLSAAHPAEVMVHEGPGPDGLMVPHTGTIQIQAFFHNHGNETLYLDAHEDCMRIRIWIDVDGEPLELTDFTERWSCPDVSAGSHVPPTNESYPRIEQEALLRMSDNLDPAGAGLEIGRTYPLYAAFDATNSTWNTTAATNLTIVDASSLPRIHIGVLTLDPLTFNATFHNTSNVTFGYTTGDSCDFWTVEIRRGDDVVHREAIPQGQRACWSAVTRQSIEPGEQRSHHMAWDHDLPPGDYTVIVDIRGDPTWDASARFGFTLV